MTYIFPNQEIVASLKYQANIYRVFNDTEKYSELDFDFCQQVITEIGKFCQNEISPLNFSSDKEGANLVDGSVITAKGFKEAYKKFTENGWMGLTFPKKYGGGEMPYFLSAVLTEALNSSCMSFALCILLSLGGAKAIAAKATKEQKERLLTNIVSGKWTVSMNLTEPQAGSDLAAIKSTAQPQIDGTYLLKGQKIFITYGDHDMAENIIHLVLARLPNAPDGIKGISMFMVPKYHIEKDGSCLQRNDAKVVSLEHKLGIHASPTCTMQYGEENKCVGELLGKEHCGIENMFVMMNLARLDVGLQGVGIAQRATLAAVEYSKDRKQGKTTKADECQQPINKHPDVKRQLLEMQSLTMAARSICYLAATEYDLSKYSKEQSDRELANAKVQFLTPIAKSFASDVGVKVSSMAIQLYGGMGYIEETGVAQYYRDARIAPIYEGTNGIQAIDFVMRKLNLLDGKLIDVLNQEISSIIVKIKSLDNNLYLSYAKQLEDCWQRSKQCLEYLDNCVNKQNKLAIATPTLSLFALLCAGKILGNNLYENVRSNNLEEARILDEDKKILYFGDFYLPKSYALHHQITCGSERII